MRDKILTMKIQCYIISIEENKKEKKYEFNTNNINNNGYSNFANIQ